MKDYSEDMCWDCPTPDNCDHCKYHHKENEKLRQQQRNRERKEKKKRYQENFS